MNENQFQEISNKLDALIRLSALALVYEKKQQEQIAILNKVGFQPKEIAEVLGTTANTVSVVLSKMRKK